MRIFLTACMIAVITAALTLIVTTHHSTEPLTTEQECMQEWNKLNNDSTERFGLTDEYNYLKTCEATR